MVIKIKYFCFIIILFGYLFSCDYSNKNPRDLFHTEYNFWKLVKNDSLVLYLDEACPNIIPASYFDDTLNTFFSFANNSIYGFDLSSRKKLTIIPLEKGNVGRLSSFAIFKDTVLIVDYNNQCLVFLDKVGNLLQKIDVNKYIELPLVGAMPVLNGNDFYYFTSKSPDDSYSLLVMNKKNYNIHTYMKYPEMYKYDWGGLLFRIPYAVYNKNDNRIYISFPADHFIYAINCNNRRIDKYFAGSQYIDKTVPIKRVKSKLDNARDIAHYIKTDNYSNLLYDPYNQVYYRIAELKRPKIPRLEAKILSIIILDTDLNVKGETLLEDRFVFSFRYTIFVNKDGLHIQFPSSEDKMIFGVYKLVKNEK